MRWIWKDVILRQVDRVELNVTELLFSKQGIEPKPNKGSSPKAMLAIHASTVGVASSHMSQGLTSVASSVSVTLSLCP